MAFVPVANTALCEVRMLANGQNVENTLWFEFPAPPTLTDLGTVTALVFDWWTTNYAPLVSDLVQLREIVTTSMHAADAPVDSFTPGSPEFGTSTSNIVPGNVTLSISFRTASRGRAFRGRNYAVGLTEDQITGNDFTAGVTDLWQAAYFALIALAAANDSAWVVVSRFHGKSGTPPKPTPRAAGITTFVTNVVVVDNFVDSQRRRLTGRGK